MYSYLLNALQMYLRFNSIFTTTNALIHLYIKQIIKNK